MAAEAVGGRRQPANSAGADKQRAWTTTTMTARLLSGCCGAQRLLTLRITKNLCNSQRHAREQPR